MRTVPQMKVEVDGVTVFRPGVLDVLAQDLVGKPTIAHMRPQLLPGETLVERVGCIPAIIKEAPCLSTLS